MYIYDRRSAELFCATQAHRGSGCPVNGQLVKTGTLAYEAAKTGESVAQGVWAEHEGWDGQRDLTRHTVTLSAGVIVVKRY